MLILVAVDGSDGSREALRWAHGLAGVMRARICVVQAWQFPSTAALPGGPTLRSQADAANQVAAEAAQLLRDEIGDRAEEIEVIVEPGAADVAVLRVAARHEADLVVVGRRGRGAVTGRLIGSVSRRILEHATCPVAVVPTPIAHRDGPVVVGVDGSANAGAALEWATTVAAAQGCPLVVVHAALSLAPASSSHLGDEMDRAGQALADEQSRPAIDAGLDVRTVVRTVDPRTLITATARELDARLVVAGSRGAGPIASLLMGSTATYLAERSECPLVLVPSDDREATAPSGGA